MKVTDNSGFYAAQERKTTTIADRAKIADQNRANAEIAEKVALSKDSVNIRTNGAIEISPLDSFNLQSILEKLTLDIFGNEEKALSAQGNLDPKAVLALLEE